MVKELDLFETNHGCGLSALAPVSPVTNQPMPS
jgi:hypothetical protein